MPTCRHGYDASCPGRGYGKVIGFDPIKERDICDLYQVRKEEIAILQEGKRCTLAGDSQFTIIRDWKSRGVRTARPHGKA